MDVFGYVNNMFYFCFMEQCCIEWLEEVFGFIIVGEEGLVIVNVYCNFCCQMKYFVSILVQMSVGYLGCMSVEIMYVICDVVDEQIIYVDGVVKIVWVDFKKEKFIVLFEKL